MKCNTNEADKLDLAWLLKPPERPPKIAKPTIFLVDFAGYWGKFSISNNHASANPHRLRYCHCAKMTTQLNQLAFTTSNCQNTSGLYVMCYTTCYKRLWQETRFWLVTHNASMWGHRDNEDDQWMMTDDITSLIISYSPRVMHESNIHLIVWPSANNRTRYI